MKQPPPSLAAASLSDRARWSIRELLFEAFDEVAIIASEIIDTDVTGLTFVVGNERQH